MGCRDLAGDPANSDEADRAVRVTGAGAERRVGNADDPAGKVEDDGADARRVRPHLRKHHAERLGLKDRRRVDAEKPDAVGDLLAVPVGLGRAGSAELRPGGERGSNGERELLPVAVDDGRQVFARRALDYGGRGVPCRNRGATEAQQLVAGLNARRCSGGNGV